MNWRGTWKHVPDKELWGEAYDKAINLKAIPCNVCWGISDCWPCYLMADFEDTLRMTLELAWFGRATALVTSRASWGGLHSLKTEDLSCSWWKEKEKS